MRLVVGDRTFEGARSKFKRIKIPIQDKRFWREPFNARYFLIWCTDLSSGVTMDVDEDERWVFYKWGFTEDGTCANLYFNVVSEYLSVADIAKRVAEIKEVAGDPEIAHAKEDELWYGVLCSIRDGASNAEELARACLESTHIEFGRWCG